MNVNPPEVPTPGIAGGENPKATLAKQLAGVVLDPLAILGALDEDMGYCEGLIEGE